MIKAGLAACCYPDTCYLYLDETGLGPNPVLVLVGFFIGNDIDYLSWGEHVWEKSTRQACPVESRSRVS